MSCSRPVKNPRRQTVLLKKADLFTNIAQNWFQTEQLTQYYNTNFSPLTEVKKAEAFSQLFVRKSEKCWHQNIEELWKLNSLKKSFKYLEHAKDRIT